MYIGVIRLEIELVCHRMRDQMRTEPAQIIIASS